MMGGRVARSVAAAAIAAAFAASPALAQEDEDEEVVVDTIHSNLPLYTFEWEDLWPRNFHDEDSWGCLSRVGFGDWKVELPDSEDATATYWDRYSNYGVFHCSAIIRSAEERAKLDEAEYKYGSFVRLGTMQHESSWWELWALQQGTVPGSDYLLLARQAGQEGLIGQFHLLQQRCPPDKVLEVEFDVWRTRYCAINSREDLLALAREMLRLGPRGTITRDPETPSNNLGVSSE